MKLSSKWIDFPLDTSGVGFIDSGSFSIDSSELLISDSFLFSDELFSLAGNFSSDELVFSEDSVSSVETVVSSGIISEFLDKLVSSGIIVVFEVVSMEMIALTESVADISELFLLVF